MGSELKNLVVYHADCADGFAAAFAAWQKFGDNAAYIPARYDRSLAAIDPRLANPLNLGGIKVYILDFSFKKEEMDFLFQWAGGVVWLDHHKSSFDMYGLNPDNVCTERDICNHHFHVTIELNTSKSGCILAWRHFWPEKPAPVFFRYIDDRDRWQFKYVETKAFAANMWSYRPWTFKLWERFLTTWFRRPLFDEAPTFTAHWHEFLDEGRAILRSEAAIIAQIATRAQPCALWPAISSSPQTYAIPWQFDQSLGAYLPVCGLAVNSPVLVSELGHELATKSGTFGLIWYQNNDKAICALRSNGDYDVSNIARAFGGGGHKNAAGFTSDISQIQMWLSADRKSAV